MTKARGPSPRLGTLAPPEPEGAFGERARRQSAAAAAALRPQAALTPRVSGGDRALWSERPRICRICSYDRAEARRPRADLYGRLVVERLARSGQSADFDRPDERIHDLRQPSQAEQQMARLADAGDRLARRQERPELELQAAPWDFVP